ncbi:MAG TPA: isocitrate lyase/PEP mutase family protein [Candidatus Thermoplasmatota archaeon]|nr:isocitrate lyase/PEP mutase family protein [Candidatus Thermoplasmatota archaeon]
MPRNPSRAKTPSSMPRVPDTPFRTANQPEAFRALLAFRPYVFTTGIHSPFQAMLARMAGLPCVYMSGYSTALGRLGVADLGFPTLTEMVDNAKYIARAAGIPVIADADDGYGDAKIVQRTVAEFEQVGVAGIHLEDQTLPKRCGHLGGKRVIPVDEAVGKFRAAVDARVNPNFFLIARTDAYGAANARGDGFEESLERGRRYADAGMDMVWPEMPTASRDDAVRWSEAFRETHPDVPLGFNYSSSFRWHEEEDPLTVSELGKLGYRYIFTTLGAIHAEALAVLEYMEGMRRTEERAVFRLERMRRGAPTESHHVLGRFEHFKEIEKRYLPPEEVKARYALSTGFGADGGKLRPTATGGGGSRRNGHGAARAAARGVRSRARRA